MTDRELLELAGRASGELYTEERNPLERDDLALRLAVKLELDMTQRVVGGMRYEVLPPGGPMTQLFYKPTDDACSVLRRAIVLSAAEIGKAMP